MYSAYNILCIQPCHTVETQRLLPAEIVAIYAELLGSAGGVEQKSHIMSDLLLMLFVLMAESFFMLDMYKQHRNQRSKFSFSYANSLQYSTLPYYIMFR